jgi:hypothetical protein
VNQDQIVQLLLDAARGVVGARFGVRAETLWPSLEPGLRGAAGRLVGEAIEAAKRKTKRRFSADEKTEEQLVQDSKARSMKRLEQDIRLKAVVPDALLLANGKPIPIAQISPYEASRALERIGYATLEKGRGSKFGAVPKTTWKKWIDERIGREAAVEQAPEGKRKEYGQAFREAFGSYGEAGPLYVSTDDGKFVFAHPENPAEVVQRFEPYVEPLLKGIALARKVRDKPSPETTDLDSLLEYQAELRGEESEARAEFAKVPEGAWKNMEEARSAVSFLDALDRDYTSAVVLSLLRGQLKDETDFDAASREELQKIATFSGKIEDAIRGTNSSFVEVLGADLLGIEQKFGGGTFDRLLSATRKAATARRIAAQEKLESLGEGRSPQWWRDEALRDAERFRAASWAEENGENKRQLASMRDAFVEMASDKKADEETWKATKAVYLQVLDGFGENAKKAYWNVPREKNWDEKRKDAEAELSRAEAIAKIPDLATLEKRVAERRERAKEYEAKSLAKVADQEREAQKEEEQLARITQGKLHGTPIGEKIPYQVDRALNWLGAFPKAATTWQELAARIEEGAFRLAQNMEYLTEKYRSPVAVAAKDLKADDAVRRRMDEAQEAYAAAVEYLAGKGYELDIDRLVKAKKALDETVESALTLEKKKAEEAKKKEERILLSQLNPEERRAREWDRQAKALGTNQMALFWAIRDQIVAESNGDLSPLRAPDEGVVEGTFRFPFALFVSSFGTSLPQMGEPAYIGGKVELNKNGDAVWGELDAFARRGNWFAHVVTPTEEDSRKYAISNGPSGAILRKYRTMATAKKVLKELPAEIVGMDVMGSTFTLTKEHPAVAKMAKVLRENAES